MARIITIARGIGSGGRTVGKMLSEDMGIKYYDKELIKLASDESGINERFFGLVDEKLKGSFLRKGGVYKGELLDPDDHDFTSDRNLFNYQAKIIKQLADRELADALTISFVTEKTCLRFSYILIWKLRSRISSICMVFLKKRLSR